MALGIEYAAAAFRDQVPISVLKLKCRFWCTSSGRAEDLAEEATAEAFRKSLTIDFEGQQHYRAWITRTAINAAIDIVRREAYLQAYTSQVRLESSSTQNSSSSDLHTALESLTEEFQTLLKLTFFERLTLEELSERLLPDDTRTPNAKRLHIKRRRDLALAELRTVME